MGWATAFGSEYDVPKAIKRMVEIGMLKDMSFKNDSAPSFGYSDDEKDLIVRIWVEHPDEGKRELGGKRYAVSVEKGGASEDHFSTDSVTDVIHKWQEYMGQYVLI